MATETQAQVNKDYILNPKTGVLHYRGYCQHTKGCLPDNYEQYDTENDAAKAGGRAIRNCIICMRNRENGTRKY